MPAAYNINRLKPEVREALEKEVQLWIEQGFVEPTAFEKLQGTIPIMAVEQLHKTTPVRPVMDYKWLNALIRSSPNETFGGPLSCPDFIRRWRSWLLPTTQISLVDLRKAYMQVRVKHEQTFYQAKTLKP